MSTDREALQQIKSIVDSQLGAPATPTTPTAPTTPTTPTTPSTPTTPPPGGNQGTIQPPIPWGAGQPQSEEVQARFQSGEIKAYPIPAPPLGRASLAFTQGQQPATAAHTTTEYFVSRTPGVIVNDGTQNYYKSGTQDNNGITIYTRPIPEYGYLAAASIPGAFAPADQGQWYINVRLTFPVAPSWGYGGCSHKWGAGAW